MGSRIMHYCISSLLADKLGIDNRNEFMLGGIAPDIHGLMGVEKGVTHFKDRDENGKSRINFVRFAAEYRESLDRPFYLSYLCHLISDVVWLELYFKVIGSTSIEKGESLLQTAYRDFARLNGRIINEYSLQLLQHKVPDINIENYKVEFVAPLLDLLGRDFVPDVGRMNEPLELFKNDNSEIKGFIHDSVERCLDFCRTI